VLARFLQKHDDLDVAEPEVHILAVVVKHLTYEWLEQHGIPL
jgi:hypothetical protein